MKSRAKTVVKILSFSILFSCIVFGLYAQSEYVDLLASNEDIAKYKTLIKKKSNIELAIVDDAFIVEEQKEIEDWMLHLTIQKDEFYEESYLEEWMFDEYFWKIKRPVWDEEVIEEAREIEGWMMNLKLVKKRSSKLFMNFREEQWMKKHAFLVL